MQEIPGGQISIEAVMEMMKQKDFEILVLKSRIEGLNNKIKELSDQISTLEDKKT